MDHAELIARLEPLAVRLRAEQEKAYLKSDLRFLGVPRPALRQVACTLDVPDPVAFAAQVWGDGVHELRALAVMVLEKRARELGPEALPALERLVRTSYTWALVDDLAVHVVGSIAARHDVSATLDRWATDPDFWIRRSSLLALLLPLRRGEGDFDRFERYAVPMLGEKEFFVRKAIGWVLRETGRKRPDLVGRFVMTHHAAMSGVTFREAIKPLPAPMREAMIRLHAIAPRRPRAGRAG